MWHIQEHKSVGKSCRKVPPIVLKKYELWKDLLFRHGPAILKEFPGFHDEQLQGDRKGQRSSRLNLQYRVIYYVDKNRITIYVLEISPHVY